MSNSVDRLISQYLGVTLENAPFVRDRLEKYAFGNDPYLFDELRDIAMLERLERGLREVEAALDVFSMTQAAHETLSQNIIRGPHQQRVECELRYADAEMQEYMLTVGKPASDAVFELQHRVCIILAGVKSTKEDIKRSDRKRKGLTRMNLRGIQMVSAARDVWAIEKGEEAPARALNPASRFGKFLSELFDAYEVPGDPKAAFRAWANQFDSD